MSGKYGPSALGAAHISNECEILFGLSRSELRTLADLLREIILSLSDEQDGSKVNSK
jgi:hypothetical protein